MSTIQRVGGIVRQDIYMTRREVTLWADLFFFSIINVLVFGLIAKQFSNGAAGALYVLSGMLLWEVIRLCQYTVTVTSMWNVWSHNLSNMFIAPISIGEYVMGNLVTSAIKTLAVLVPLSLITWAVFGFNIGAAGLLPLILVFIDLILFATSLGLILLGLIFRYGTRVQALAWSAVYLFQPLIGVYFPLSVLPTPFQHIAQLIPATHAFEGLRNSLSGAGPVYGPLLWAMLYGLIGLALAYWAFAALQKRALSSGQFARNDS